VTASEGSSSRFEIMMAVQDRHDKPCRVVPNLPAAIAPN
jgi:hypothetical protein